MATMDIEPGGEQTQYEGQAVFNQPAEKQTPTLSTGDGSGEDEHRKLSDEKAERGKKTAENIRYGQAISEQGFQGQTVGMSGSAQQASGIGGVSADEDTQTTSNSRAAQGYDSGTEIGG